MEKRGKALLKEMEEGVLAEGQAWMRTQYEMKLKELANEVGKVSPPQREKVKRSASKDNQTKNDGRRSNR